MKQKRKIGLLSLFLVLSMLVFTACGQEKKAANSVIHVGTNAEFPPFEYIDENENLFPTATNEAVQSSDIQDFSSKQFNKTRRQDQIGLLKLDLYAVQVFEDDYLGGKLTYLLAADDDNNYYALYYLDSTEVYNEDTFTAYAIPCSTSSFDNISGGTTNVIVLAACYIG